MLYYATFTLLINGATFGHHEEEFEAENSEELFEMVYDFDTNHETEREEFLLDSITSESGEEIDTSLYFDYFHKRASGEIKPKDKLPF